MSLDLEHKLPEDVLGRVFQRGGRHQQHVFEWLWNELKKDFPDAECRPKERYVGMYVNASSNTFAKIDSQSDGPVIGVDAKVIVFMHPQVIQPRAFPEWGGYLEGFHLSDHTAWELLALLKLAYRYKVGGNRVLVEYEDRQVEVVEIARNDIEAIEEQEPGPEGDQKTRVTVAAERNPKLRAAAINIHGLTCKACGFSFEEFYGELGKDFIEVHHKEPLGEHPGERQTDPSSDLTVVCSNCHRMLHRTAGAVLSMEDLKRMIRQKRKQK